MILRITHHTRYIYAGPAIESHNELRITPVTDENQRRLDFRIITNPAARTFARESPGGTVHNFSVRIPHDSLDVKAVSEVETHTQNPFARLNLVVPDWDGMGQAAQGVEAAEMLMPSRYVAIDQAVRDMADAVGSQPTVAKWILALRQKLFDEFTYDPDVTHVHSTVQEVLALRGGVCQDFAHVMIACCRSKGIPARYVSGFLYCSKEEELRGNMATHAWVECMVPGGTWVGVDPTNNVLANDHHVKVFTGRDYSEVTPTRGIYVGPPTTTLDVAVAVERTDG